MGQDLFDHSGSTGMVLVIVHGNKVFIEGYGETAPRSHQTPSKDSYVRLCSLSKIFTTDVLTKMVLDHTVELNDPLQKYAPEGAVVPQRGGQPITLLDLATHTAGLHREAGYPPAGAASFTYPDYALRWSWLPQQKLRWKPGAIASYSNIGFDLLSDALASAAHRQYVELLSERTLKPLDMRETTYFPSAAQCQRLMTGARNNSDCTVTENTAGSSGLYSTPADMARWLKYLLGAGGEGFPAQPQEAQQVYLRPDQLTRMMGLNYAGDPSGLGLGWVHVLAANDPSHLVEKTGGGAGFLTYIAIHPASHTALFVATTDGRHASHFNLFKASNALLLNLVGAPPIPEPEAKPKAKQRKGAARKKRTSAAVVRTPGPTAAKPAGKTLAPLAAKRRSSAAAQQQARMRRRKPHKRTAR
jgi:D-alanyl-D-alanine-carboxypeptidase/D-alanyl-D-alanine-endopeptidase